MRLEEFKPRVLTSFVRNRLLDEVYLPLIGDNLAKQMGAAGEDKRTDRMGLLLLISPPGYGKTTLMEYIANRLGIVFMKINGPAIGHAVTSLDPSEAPNAAAREEVERLNLALEMGDNVMLYSMTFSTRIPSSCRSSFRSAMRRERSKACVTARRALTTYAVDASRSSWRVTPTPKVANDSRFRTCCPTEPMSITLVRSLGTRPTRSK